VLYFPKQDTILLELYVRTVLHWAWIPSEEKEKDIRVWQRQRTINGLNVSLVMTQHGKKKSPNRNFLNLAQILWNKLEIDDNMELYYVYLGSKDTCWLYKALCKKSLFLQNGTNSVILSLLAQIIIKVFCNPCTKNLSDELGECHTSDSANSL
jgi:hypothetical protein